jgi:hypothetical protein
MFAARILGFSLLVTATISDAQAPLVHVEFPGMFSGRLDPAVLISDSAQAQSILDTLAARLASSSTCDLAPLTTLGYNGVSLSVDDPVLGKKSVTVRDGCISTGVQDANRNLERLVVSTAFRYDDLNTPGTPAPLASLACRIPDSLHPGIAPCATTSVKPAPVIDAGAHHRPSLSATTPRSTSIDGRRSGRQGACLSWSFPQP